VLTANTRLISESGIRPNMAKFLVLLLLLTATTTGCAHFHMDRHGKVYVYVRLTYLRDRVATVSNRIAQVTNGQELEVLGHNRRFLKVKTDKNVVGWIEERSVIDEATHEAFVKLAERSAKDPVVATAVARDDIYLHLRPGRDTDRFYLLAANTKVQLLARGSTPKSTSGSTAPSSQSQAAAKSTAADAQSASDTQPATPPVVMEDWWLVRDGQGHTGWLLSRGVDMDIPVEILIYGERQRIVGAYALTKVIDPEAETPNHEVPVYVALLCTPKAGLSYDFDQIKVFTWNTKRHRYETAFRTRGIQGYLPVTIGSQQRTNGGSAPTFSFQIASNANIATDPDTGVNHPVSPRTISFVLLDTTVRRTGSDMGPIPVMQSDDDKAKADKAAKKKKR
jgi:hypothetical protein